MAGTTNKIATNKWIKDNITPAYTDYDSKDNNKCPSISFIDSCSKNLISVSGVTNYSGNTKLVKETDLSVGTRTKEINFTFNNVVGITIDQFKLFVSRPGKEDHILINVGIGNKKEETNYKITAPLLGKGCKLKVFINASSNTRDDQVYWYDDSEYYYPPNYNPSNYNSSNPAYLFNFKVSNSNPHFYYTFDYIDEYDIWAIKTGKCKLELRD